LAGLFIKLLVCPAVVILADALFPEVFYPSLYQSISVGMLLALAGHFLEVSLLKRGTLWMITLIDMAGACAIVFVSAYLLSGTRVTFLGAVFTAILLTVTEYLQHVWLISSGRTEKA
jgi:hypothetical protein